MKTTTMERAVTPLEAAIVGWLLEHASFGDVTAYRLKPVEELRVIGGCDCSCTSLVFQPGAPGARMIADALAVYPDTQQAGLILWGLEGEILWLEVYDFHPEASHRFPLISNLRTWEDHGREQV